MLSVVEQSVTKNNTKLIQRILIYFKFGTLFLDVNNKFRLKFQFEIRTLYQSDENIYFFQFKIRTTLEDENNKFQYNVFVVVESHFK